MQSTHIWTAFCSVNKSEPDNAILFSCQDIQERCPWVSLCMASNIGIHKGSTLQFCYGTTNSSTENSVAIRTHTETWNMIDIGTALEPCVSLQIMAMGINHEHINNCRPKGRHLATYTWWKSSRWICKSLKLAHDVTWIKQQQRIVYEYLYALLVAGKMSSESSDIIYSLFYLVSTLYFSIPSVQWKTRVSMANDVVEP